MKHTHVKLVYFKKTGKYYGEGEWDVPHRHADRPAMFHECLEEVGILLNNGIRPGLVNGRDFDVLATVYTEFGPLSHLFVRDEDGYVGSRSLRVKE